MQSSIFSEYVKVLGLLIKEFKGILLSEFFIWIVLALILSWPLWLGIYQEPDELNFFFRTYNLEFAFGLIIAIFPIAFYQVFGLTPLRYLRKHSIEKKSTPNIYVEENAKVIIQNIPDSLSEKKPIDDALVILNNALSESNELASKLYVRGGIYLVFGVLIAIGGLVFFSLQNFDLNNVNDINLIFIKLLPYVGILFFIEFIAFFFLRQYRQAMHEFRYFENIKRTRESQLFLFLSTPKAYREENPKEFSEILCLFQKHGVLDKGEKSELMEIAMNSKDELEVISNLLSIIGKSKTHNK